MSGDLSKLTSQRRIIEFFGVQLFPMMMLIFLYYGFISSVEYWVLWIVLVFGSVILLLDHEIIPIWFSSIYLIIHFSIASLWCNVPFDFWWTILGILIVWTIIIIVLYYMQPNLCYEQNKYYCSKMSFKTLGV